MKSVDKRRPSSRRLGGETPRKCTNLLIKKLYSNNKSTDLHKKIVCATGKTSPITISPAKSKSTRRCRDIKVAHLSKDSKVRKSSENDRQKNDDKSAREKLGTEDETHLAAEALPARLEEFNYLIDCVGDAVSSRQGTCICKFQYHNLLRFSIISKQ